MEEEFKEQFECLGENTEKYKELENNKKIAYKIQFIYSVRFVPSALSNLVDDLAEGLTMVNT